MNEYIGEYEKELIQKSYKYSIPVQYKDQQINWLQLIDDIETREQLLKEAYDLDIDIEDCMDDPTLIRRLIKEEEKLESNYKNDVLSYYYSTRGC